MRIKQRLKQLKSSLPEPPIFILPTLIGAVIGVQLFIQLGKRLNLPSAEHYKVLLSIIAFVATLCGLSFRASSCTDKTWKKKEFYAAGERLLLSTLIFIAVITLQYLVFGLPRQPLAMSGMPTVAILGYSFFVLFILEMILFISGTIIAARGILKIFFAVIKKIG